MKKFNDGMARGEAALAIGMLLFMILVAFAQAALRNLTLIGMDWANDALAWLDWADFVIQKGTLWLAFLGASLAAHGNRHIAIDIVPRLAPPRMRLFLRGLVGVIGGVISLYLARAFWVAVLVNGEERPPGYEILSAEGSVHVCDATAAQMASAPTAEAGFYCNVRAVFMGLDNVVNALASPFVDGDLAKDVVLNTPGAAFQSIVPIMFVFMFVRMLGNGYLDLSKFARGGTLEEELPAEAQISGHEEAHPEAADTDAGGDNSVAPEASTSDGATSDGADSGKES